MIGQKLKTAPPTGGHTNILTNFELGRDCIGAKLLTKFHEDGTRNQMLTDGRTKTGQKSSAEQSVGLNVTLLAQQGVPGLSGLDWPHNFLTLHVFQRTGTIFELNSKNCPAPWWPCFSPISTIFELIQDINKTNVLTKFHDDWAKIVTYSVFTRKTAPPTGTIFKLNQGIIGTNLLTKFHEDRTRNVTSRVFTNQMLTDGKTDGRRTKTDPKSSPEQLATKTIFKLIQDIIGTNLLTKFHDDRKINVASRVLTMKNAPPPGCHVFIATKTILKLIQDITRTNLLMKFHEDRKINVASRVLTRKNAPPPRGRIFQPTGIKLVQDIIVRNLLIKFHEDQTINVASSVKNAPPLGSHVYKANVTIFELIQDIIEANLLTKFHEDWTINVASRELTRQMFTAHAGLRTTHNGQNAITKAHHEHIVLR
ncbi:hypothetical protein DPMN_045638 [Dreissena polymorpha]|uniref:Uncharacterized protein n=1 Tax=Dreissena polymorpha TaxID=45954 RepID=A0A9D4D6P9_DREPO|nr:hypothetical protein DPMN_045638 [Dreissena polymorpha]